MRTLGIVADAPGFDEIVGLVEVMEQVLVEALVAEPSVEEVHRGALRRLSRSDVVPLHTPILLLAQDRVTDQFRLIVVEDVLRDAAPDGDPVRLSGHAQAG